jgi:beta-mannanase
MDFKQKFEPKEGKVLHGAGQSPEQFKKYWNAVENYKPIIYMTYIRINEIKEKFRNKVNEAKKISPDLMLQIGLNLKAREIGEQCKQIIKREHDQEILFLIKTIKEYKNPVFLRIGYEFNNPTQGYSSKEFISAWKYIVELFRKNNVKNIAFVWNCCTAFTRDINEIMKFYPGDEYVDWFSDNHFGAKHFTEVNNPKIITMDFLQEAEKHKKPVMIGESSPAKTGVGKGKESWNEWFKPYFKWINDHPIIKAFCYINWDWGKDWKQPEWLNGRIEENEMVRKLYVKELSKKIYIHSRT